MSAPKLHIPVEPRGLRREMAADPILPLVRKLIERDRGRDPPVPEPSVYAVQVLGYDLVKIGYSRNPDRRIADLRNGSGMCGGLEMLMRIPGRPALEGQLHRRFAQQHLFGEWFTLCGPVADWINETVLARIEGGSR